MLKMLLKLGRHSITSKIQNLNVSLSNKKLYHVNTHYGNFLIRPSIASNWIIDEVVNRQCYEQIKKPCKQDIILDLGMNIGIYSVYIARKYCVKVVGVEPVPKNYELAVANIKHNGMENYITPINKAISDKDDQEIKIWLDDKNSGGHSAIQNIEGNRQNYITVKTVSLITLLDKYNPTFIKCDIEGMEWAIFSLENKGIIEKLKNVNFIAMEVHKFDNHVFHIMKLFLESIGYSVTLIEDHWDQKSAMLYALRKETITNKQNNVEEPVIAQVQSSSSFPGSHQHYI